MGNYSSSEFANLRDLQIVLDNTTSDITQVLPDINDWPDALLHSLIVVHLKSIE
jgi:hypothetical protein